MQAFHVFRAEIIADHDPGADGKAGKEKDDHSHDHRGRTDRRQCLFADEVSHNDRIHRIVQHLEDIAQHQRQGKENKLPQNRPLGHVERC